MTQKHEAHSANSHASMGTQTQRQKTRWREMQYIPHAGKSMSETRMEIDTRALSHPDQSEIRSEPVVRTAPAAITAASEKRASVPPFQMCTEVSV